MTPQRHEDTKIGRGKSQPLCLYILSLCLCGFVVSIVLRAGGLKTSASTSASAAPLEGCLKCHDKIEPMHQFSPTATLDKLDNGKDALGLTCTACHGGNPAATTKEDAHVRPRFPREWMRDGKFRIPERSGPLLARESLEFVRFLNPGDLRVAAQTCGTSECHTSETGAVARSMMAHGAMLWGAALYNNGGFPLKDTAFGESYGATGAPQSLV